MTADGEVLPYNFMTICLLAMQEKTTLWVSDTAVADIVVADIFQNGFTLAEKGYMTFSVMKGVNRVFYSATVRPDGTSSLKIYNLHNIFPKNKFDELRENFGGSTVLETFTNVSGELAAYDIASPTAATAAMAEYRKIGGFGLYFRRFPDSDIWRTDFRQAYAGGIIYAKNGEYGQGRSHDVNSLYPYKLRSMPMPYGEPEHYVGKYERDGNYPYHVDRLTFRADLKDDGIPWAGVIFGSTNDFTTGGYITKWITHVDMILLQKYYDVSIVEHIEGYKFAAAKGMFSAYVDDWYSRKQVAHGSERDISKLMLVSLIGKFATQPRNSALQPVFEDEELKWKTIRTEPKTIAYPPVAMYVNAFAREQLLAAMYANKDNLIYSDTDSIITTGDKVCEIEESANELGKWKKDREFDKINIIAARRYAMLLKNGETYNNLAGVQRDEIIPYSEFKQGKKCFDSEGQSFVL